MGIKPKINSQMYKLDSITTTCKILASPAMYGLLNLMISKVRKLCERASQFLIEFYLFFPASLRIQTQLQKYKKEVSWTFEFQLILTSVEVWHQYCFLQSSLTSYGLTDALNKEKSVFFLIYLYKFWQHAFKGKS